MALPAPCGPDWQRHGSLQGPQEAGEAVVRQLLQATTLGPGRSGGQATIWHRKPQGFNR